MENLHLDSSEESSNKTVKLDFVPSSSMNSHIKTPNNSNYDSKSDKRAKTHKPFEDISEKLIERKRDK